MAGRLLKHVVMVQKMMVLMAESKHPLLGGFEYLPKRMPFHAMFQRELENGHTVLRGDTLEEWQASLLLALRAAFPLLRVAEGSLRDA